MDDMNMTDIEKIISFCTISRNKMSARAESLSVADLPTVEVHAKVIAYDDVINYIIRLQNGQE